MRSACAPRRLARVRRQQIATLWQQYQDLRDRLDPFGAGVVLTDEERKRIEVAAGEGDASRLMPFGLQRLALFGYFGRAACDLTDSEVWTWFLMHRAATELRAPKGGK